MLRSLSLHHIGPSAEMTFEPGKRLNIITGDNGLGKSFLLDLAWWAVTRTWAGLPIKPLPSSDAIAQVDIDFIAQTKPAQLTVRFDRASQNWQFPRGQPGEPGLVLYARVGGGFAVWDSIRRFGDRDEEETGVPKALNFTQEELWNGLHLNGKPICNGLLADWVSWQQTENWEAKILGQTLAKLSPSDDDLLWPGTPARVDMLDARLIPTLSTPYGQEIPVTIASAGVRRIIALAYILVWAWREHLEIGKIAGRAPANRMLLIIDEVEAHLHPRWQRSILASLVDCLNRLTASKPDGDNPAPPTIQMIVATHSPLVLASIEPEFQDDLDKLFDLELIESEWNGQKQVVLNELPFRRQGDANNWLVSESFSLSSTRSIAAEKCIAEAAALLQDGLPSLEEQHRMQQKLVEVLPEFDKFWLRWRAATDQEITSNAPDLGGANLAAT
jgi:hypothetical protein